MRLDNTYNGLNLKKVLRLNKFFLVRLAFIVGYIILNGIFK